MNYAPTKKKIVFSDEIKAHRSFGSVMEVIKACGDPDFKSWLINQAPMILNSTNDAGESERNDLNAVASNLTELVGRQAQIEPDVIHACQNIFASDIKWEVTSLLAKVTGFLLSVQRFEKQIALIERDIESGVAAAQARPLTRDGQAPSYTPRSRQTNTKYKNR